MTVSTGSGVPVAVSEGTGVSTALGVGLREGGGVAVSVGVSEGVSVDVTVSDGGGLGVSVHVAVTLGPGEGAELPADGETESTTPCITGMISAVITTWDRTRPRSARSSTHRRSRNFTLCERITIAGLRAGEVRLCSESDDVAPPKSETSFYSRRHAVTSHAGDQRAETVWRCVWLQRTEWRAKQHHHHAPARCVTLVLYTATTR